MSHQVPKYLSQQWEKAAEKGEVGKISIGKQVVKCVPVIFIFLKNKTKNMLFMCTNPVVLFVFEHNI